MAKQSPFTGHWLITSMSAWGDEYLDEEVEARTTPRIWPNFREARCANER